MDTQKDYIAHFRQEAEAIVEQQVAELQTTRFRDDGPASSSPRATGDHLQKLEEELKQRIDQVVKEVGPDNDTNSVRSELMNFYRSYVEEFTTRTASQP